MRMEKIRSAARRWGLGLGAAAMAATVLSGGVAAVAYAVAVPTLFVGPLVLMLVSGKRSEYIRRQAMEALNLQVTLLLITIVTFGVGGALYAVTWILSAIAAVFALAGRGFRYPWILRLVK